MVMYEDLSTYVYSDSTVSMLNIGWLGAERPFETGVVEAEVLAALKRGAVDPANLMRGSHTCEFCGAESPIMIQVSGVRAGRAFLGNGEIHIPGLGGVVYSAPTLIVHYIEVHGYRPPDIFMRAVLAESGSAR
jgi:hypothetical protein